MNNQIIVELRENDPSATNLDVASWENTLLEPLTINEGDTLSLKGCFIDSVAQNSGRIQVAPDDPSAPIGSDARTKTTISMTFAYYWYDWGLSTDNLSDRAYIPANQGFTSGKNYVLCDKQALGGADIVEVEGLNLINAVHQEISRLPKNLQDPLHFYFHYLNQSGVETKLYFQLDQEIMLKHGYTGNGSGGQFTINQHLLSIEPAIIKGGAIGFPFLAVKDGIGGGTAGTTIEPDSTIHIPNKEFPQKYIDGSDYIKWEFMTYVGNIEVVVGDASGNLYQPRLITYDFKIDARDYAPDELARILSKNFTKTEQELYIEDQYAICDNSLLTTSRSLQVIGTAVVDNSKLPAGFDPIPAGTPNQPPSWVRDDGLAIASYNLDSDNYIVGTTQFAIEFNENIGAEGIFQISQMHTPLVDASSNTICKCIDIGVVASAGNVRVKYVANKNGGILITCLEPRSLWEDQMKFDTSSLLTTFTMRPSQTLGGLPNVRTCSFSVVDGENATGALKSIDVPFNKDGTFDKVKAYPYDVKTPMLMEISAKESLDSGDGLDEGYYLVEIGSNFFTDKRSGSSTKKNIMGLVSRFYQQDSFTSAVDGQGSFEYTHKGEPIQISSLSCRILNADHTLATNLKSNNTIFLQINRNTNQ